MTCDAEAIGIETEVFVEVTETGGPVPGTHTTTG